MKARRNRCSWEMLTAEFWALFGETGKEQNRTYKKTFFCKAFKSFLCNGNWAEVEMHEKLADDAICLSNNNKANCSSLCLTWCVTMIAIRNESNSYRDPRGDRGSFAIADFFNPQNSDCGNPCSLNSFRICWQLFEGTWACESRWFILLVVMDVRCCDEYLC